MDQILLAEENADDALLIQMAPERAGVFTPVHVVNSGHQLFAYLTGDGQFADRKVYPTPTAILLGLQKPLLNDFKALRWIRQHHEFDRIPVIVLAGEQYDDEAKIARQLGADCYKVKPCSLEKLIQIAREIWDKVLAQRVGAPG